MKLAGVIVVSSDPGTQDMYVHGFRARRRAVYGTSGLDDTLALARALRPSAIVVDVREPRGWQVCWRCRRDPIAQEVPLVIVTGDVAADWRCRRLASRVGCAAFLTKPARPETVADIVTRVERGERGIELITGASSEITR
jgi:CheY-like chemotaxis protein